MKTQLLPLSDPDAIPRALDLLRRDGIVAFPTDTVYGLGANAFSATGIERLFDAKGRDLNKAIAVLLGDVEQLASVASSLTGSAEKLAARFWPGALTLVVTRGPGLPEMISPRPTVGVRIPDHDGARALLRQSGALATTSANRSGWSNPLTAQDVLAQLDGLVELVLDGGAVPGGMPSTVVDCTAETIQVLREGPISTAMLHEALQA
jgi:L-threonylcarbamoyladenylate synthase